MTRYGIIGLFNEREHGKTTYAVKYLVSEVNSGINYDEAYSNIHIGLKIDKNGFHYGHPKIHFIDYAGLMKLKRPSVNGIPRTIVLLDQVANYIDARASNTKLNIEFTKWLRESRQHGVDVIYTVWMRSEVDKRLRPFTNLVISAYSTPGGFVYKRILKVGDSRKVLPTIRIPLAQARAVWKYFDSNELIEDPTIPK